jgi:iron complex outermembrane receptor protein
MKCSHQKPWYGMLTVSLLFALLSATWTSIYAQQPQSITGTVFDSKGGVLANASVTATSESNSKTNATKADGQGHFSINNLPSGKYTVEAIAPGFAPADRSGVVVSPNQSPSLTLALSIGNISEQVTVEASSSNSLAAQHAPLDALLGATSARTEINQTYIQNFTSPMADYGELTQLVPGTFTTNANGVGLGQSTTTFRGFPDGDFDIDFDGIPFYDTNTPSHHSWAFFPSQWIGGIDFDRSPGTASTIGPTPFGGSIHLLSQDLPVEQNARGGFSYGSFNTFLFDGEYNSGSFGGVNKKSNLFLDVHHMSSDGYQTFNYQTRNAGSLKYQYQISDKMVLTGFSGVVWLDANTPNLSSTRQQLITLGDNFLLQNTDPAQATYYRYNYYHVPTDFEYVGLDSELHHGWRLNFKPYTYNYDNSEYYAKQPKAAAGITPTTCQPIPTSVTEAGKTFTLGESPCAVDKYNSYRKYGETLAISQNSKLGVFRTGMWYEWANTNRHQFPSNPFTKVDDALPNFSESYKTNSYQPYGEYELHATSKLSVTAGLKFAYYTMNFTQYADNGGKIGSINPITLQPFTSVTNSVNYHSWLPSLDAHYQLKSNWSVYGQAATGSVVPPTSVFDVAGGVVAVPPKPQTSTTYQTGTVIKLKRVTFDADYYHIRFQNGYSSVTDNNQNDAQFGESINFITPSSISQGGEFESTLYIGRGLSVYLNATRGSATYVGTLTVNSPAGSTSNPLVVKAPSGLWVAGTPTDTEAEAITYQQKSWDFGFINKRVGSQWEDNGAYHNQQQVDPFSVANAYLNYTIRNNSRFNQTKVRLSFNNLTNSHNETSVTLGGKLVNQSLGSSGLTYTDPFHATTTSSPGYTGGVNLADNPTLLPGRSVIVSVIFGFSPGKR